MYDVNARHLVSSTRLVCQFAWAVRELPAQAVLISAVAFLPSCLPASLPPSPVFLFLFVFHGQGLWRSRLTTALTCLSETHRRSTTGGYAWTLGAKDGSRDDGQRCYGLVFALLAYASAWQAQVRLTFLSRSQSLALDLQNLPISPLCLARSMKHVHGLMKPGIC